LKKKPNLFLVFNQEFCCFTVESFFAIAWKIDAWTVIATHGDSSRCESKARFIGATNIHRTAVVILANENALILRFRWIFNVVLSPFVNLMKILKEKLEKF
jgi:hypothetical protein